MRGIFNANHGSGRLRGSGPKLQCLQRWLVLAVPSRPGGGVGNART